MEYTTTKPPQTTIPQRDGQPKKDKGTPVCNPPHKTCVAKILTKRRVQTPTRKGDALVRCKELAVRNREWCSEKRKIVMMAIENTMGTATPTVKNKEHTGDE